MGEISDTCPHCGRATLEHLCPDSATRLVEEARTKCVKLKEALRRTMENTPEVVAALGAAPSVLDRLEADLKRKRDECVRLEEALASVRGQLSVAQTVMAEDRIELQRLRRGKR